MTAHTAHHASAPYAGMIDPARAQAIAEETKRAARRALRRRKARRNARRGEAA